MKGGRHNPTNKKQDIRRGMHLTRPPRLEGKAKNAGVSPVRKPKGKKKGLSSQ
jgi:hypothetical protein